MIFNPIHPVQSVFPNRDIKPYHISRKTSTRASMWNQKRTKCIFELVQYNWVIIPIIVGCIYRGNLVLATKVVNLIYIVLRRFWNEERSSYIVIDNTIHVAWSSLLCSCKWALLYTAVMIALSEITSYSSFRSSQPFYCPTVPCILLSPTTVPVIEATHSAIFQSTSHLPRNPGWSDRGKENTLCSGDSDFWY